MIDPASQCYAHGMNLCEVFYQFHRAGGESAATGAINDLQSMNVIERADFDQAFWQDAGRLKSNGGVSLADCSVSMEICSYSNYLTTIRLTIGACART